MPRRMLSVRADYVLSRSLQLFTPGVLHDPVRDYKTRSKLCAILEHELGLAQDNHERSQTQGNDVTPKSGQESFQVGLTRHAQGSIRALKTVNSCRCLPIEY